MADEQQPDLHEALFSIQELVRDVESSLNQLILACYAMNRGGVGSRLSQIKHDFGKVIAEL